MKKLWVKSSKKKQRLYEKTVKNRNAEKELDYKQYKALLKSLKNQRKTVTKILLIHANILLKIWDVMKEIIWNKKEWLIETKESPMSLFPILSWWKADKYSTKKKLQKHLIIILLISVWT